MLLPILLGLLLLPSCESDIYESNDSGMLIEQYSPVKNGNEMKLTGNVSLPKASNLDNVKVGFFIAEYQEGYDWEYYSSVAESAVGRYNELLVGVENYYEGQYIWADELDTNGNFSASFVPQMKQYVCVGFAFNILERYADDGTIKTSQSVVSRPFFFAGEASITLEEYEAWGHGFKVTYNKTDGVDMDICWSATNKLPNIDDSHIDVTVGASRSSSDSLSTVIVSGLDFGDNDVVYVRAVLQQYINDYSSNSVSYKTIYSNVIEFHPYEQVKEINSKDEIQSLFINANGDETQSLWDLYRGKLIFNYEVQKHDWLRSPEDTTNYFYIDRLRCTVQGKGKLPYIYNVEKSATIKGMDVPRCDRNYGIIEETKSSYISMNEGQILNSTNVYIDYNYGELLNSTNVYVNDNNGLVQGCTDIQETNPNPDYDYYGEIMNRMVYNNQSLGKIIDCKLVNDTINSSMICGINYGYIENCTPDSVCCENNYGVIKGASNAGGGTTVTE